MISQKKHPSLVVHIAQQAKNASRIIAQLSTSQKNSLLQTASKILRRNTKKILSANTRDVAGAKKLKLSAALVDRLTLTPARIEAMAQALESIAKFPDPIGETVRSWKGQGGIHLKRVRVPLGVVAMVYESRPNVTMEAAALCLKAGNAVILRGGKEAAHSNTALANVLHQALRVHKIPNAVVTLLPKGERQNIYELARMDGKVDLLIARGSETMVRSIQEKATVPVLGHGKGLCHVYVDADADLRMAENIALNAKVQRPGVCNAMETLLVHRSIAKKFLPKICARYFSSGVVVKGDVLSQKIVREIVPASEKDWDTEYLDLTVSIKTVANLGEALDHIHRYGSGHTETIVTKNKTTAQKFLNAVDAACVFHNISTRMHDGGVFGLGAEIGISTAKLHARGTMGVRELTTTKYVGMGSGQIRKG